MSLLSPFDSWSRRLAVYGYLAPLFTDRKVLELGCGDGAGAARLRVLGAASVLGVDADATSLSRALANERMPGLQFAPLERRGLESAGAFDVVVVPEGAAWLRSGAPFGPTAVRGLLAPKGRLAVIVASADRPDAPNGGLGYYALVEELERLFPNVRMFGLTPFAAFGAAEFGAETSGLRIEGGLVEERADQPTHYLALAGQDEGGELGYTLLQIPAVAVATVESVHAGAASDEASRAEVTGLRRKLVEAEGQAEGVLRVSRAQTEEIEELRARLRRAAEARGELDQEVVRLRRALADADASVLDLTRRTREEVAALARQITSGLRPPEPAAGKVAEGAGMARLREELRRRGEELAARDSALSERDERIAVLEAEKQDLLWRLKAAVAKDSRTQPAPPRGQNGAARPDDTTAEELHHREQAQLAVEQYRQAAVAHLGEVNRLREALAEQSTLVSELEDALAGTSRRLQASEGEMVHLRRHAAEVEQADRLRRSRLAEVEGTLLRLQRQTAASAPAAPAPAVVVALSPTGAELEETAREITHLREALDRTEEQLWEAKGQMLLDRERLTSLELQLAATRAEAQDATEPTVSEAAHHAILRAVMAELTEIELGVRLEIGKLDSLEQLIENWRSDLAITDAEIDIRMPPVG